MAEPLKNRFGVEVIDRIAAMLSATAPGLDWPAFTRAARLGFDELELMDRARHIARALAATLPTDFRQAAPLLVGAFGPAHHTEKHDGMDGFLYLPFSLYIAEHGLGYFDEGMRANHELTQRFTAEFSIRPFIERYPQRSLVLLEQWVDDPNVHVRRLVSEGTRPRLPWAGRLRVFDDQPDVMIRLLTRLRDDPHEYVRRSVANHLNDIGKACPDLLIETCAQWMVDAPEPRQRLIRHALRSLVKAGDTRAIRILGFDSQQSEWVTVKRVRVAPAKARIGGVVVIGFGLHNASDKAVGAIVDLRVHYVKADGSRAPKVFKLSAPQLPADGAVGLTHRLSLRQMTTRRHYPGRHLLELLVNGRTISLGSFVILAD